MRTNLKVLRVKNDFTQEEAAATIDCSRQTYASIEAGNRTGTLKFWEGVQRTFNVPDAEMWVLIRNE